MGYIEVLNTIETQLLLDPFCKTVTRGDLFKVATVKQPIYPLSHVQINNMAKQGNAIRYNISIIAMDIVESDDSNEEFVINTQSFVCLRLVEEAERGTLFNILAQYVENSANFEFFRDRFEDKVAGCTVTFDILVSNNVTIC